MPIHIHRQAECAAPLEHVFGYVTDYRNTPDWLYGISAFEPVTELTRGTGAEFAGSMQLGATLHSTVRTTEFVENTTFSFESISGFKNWSTWSFEALDDDRTLITADVYYELPGGVAGKALGKVIEPFVKIAVKSSSDSLSRKAAAAQR